MTLQAQSGAPRSVKKAQIRVFEEDRAVKGAGKPARSARVRANEKTTAGVEQATAKENAVSSSSSTATKVASPKVAMVSDSEPERPSRSKASSAGPYARDAKFLAEQRKLLESERAVYQGQAVDLRAEADSLAQEREPGDVQFDEESGEGGTVTVDRERDLVLSAQAVAAVREIDEAIERIALGTYGTCERCHRPIPKARLKALPFARLCVACKSGGLSRR